MVTVEKVGKTWICTGPQGSTGEGLSREAALADYAQREEG